MTEDFDELTFLRHEVGRLIAANERNKKVRFRAGVAWERGRVVRYLRSHATTVSAAEAIEAEIHHSKRFDD